MPAPRRLSLYLAAAWTVLAVYASLYPFSGWRDSGVDPLGFLILPWPRYVTAFDLSTNIAAYVPLGFFVCIAARRRFAPYVAVIFTVAGGLLLSALLECLQNYLPSRVASNLDILCNAGGATLGALGAARWGGFMLEYGRLSHLRERLLARHPGVDSGLVLLGLWLLAQFDPTLIAFGAGDLRRLFDLPAAQAFSAARFLEIEAALSATGLLAVLMLASLLSPYRQRRLFPLLLLLLMLGLKTLAFALLKAPAEALAWATPGALGGLAFALSIWISVAQLIVPLQRALAAVCLLAATAIVNLAPSNPYLEHAIQLWNPGHFLHFHGLTQFIAAAWPFLALPWLILLPSKDEP